MATYRDPVICFAPLEVVERLLEIRAKPGSFPPYIFTRQTTLQIILTHLVSTFMPLQVSKPSFTLATIGVHWRQVATTRIVPQQRTNQ